MQNISNSRGGASASVGGGCERVWGGASDYFASFCFELRIKMEFSRFSFLWRLSYFAFFF